MSDNSKIEWTDATWNPITGCSVVSPGCTNCYAMRLAGTRLQHHPSRAGLTQKSNAGPVWTGEVRLNEDWLTQPLRWRKPRWVFVCAHGDLFHESVPDEWIDRVFAVMASRPQHTFQVLTKRAARMREYVTELGDSLARADTDGEWFQRGFSVPVIGAQKWPIPNVWLGVSVEDQTRANERILHLLATPAAVRFVSAEPLLGAMDLTRIASEWNGLSRTVTNATRAGIDWVIVGGESGPNARPMHPDWPRSLRDQCQAAGVPFFFKQWGSWITPSQSDPESMGDPPAGDAIKWLRDDGLVSDRPVSALIPGGLDDDQGEKQVIDGEEVTIYPKRKWIPAAAVGKKRAGRLLDGREWSEAPE